jgi:cytoskeletal protein CcmA (bactofilin family)
MINRHTKEILVYCPQLSASPKTNYFDRNKTSNISRRSSMNHQEHWRFPPQLKQIGLFLIAGLLLSLLFSLIPTPAWSDEIAGPKSIIIGAKEVINDDLYLAADKITIDGIVKGDAVIAASQITLNGTVEGDLIAAGRIITLNGSVNDDVRIAGQVLVLGEAARIKDDLIAAGYSLENKKGSTIGGNLSYFGAQGLFAGTVQQNLRGATAATQIAGKVNGNVNMIVGNHQLSHPPLIPNAPTIPQIPSGLTLTESAQIDGKLTYRSAADAKIDRGATIAGRVTREDLPATANQSPNVAYGIFWQLQRWLALGLVGWLLLRFVPGWTQTLSANVQSRPLPSFGWGMVAVAVVLIGPIAICALSVPLLMIAGVFLPSLALPILGIGLLALFTLLIGFMIVVSFVPPIVLSFLGGQWLISRLRPHRSLENWRTLFIGLIIFVLLTAIPVVGDVFNAIASFLGLGALWLWWRQDNRRDIARQKPLAAV